MTTTATENRDIHYETLAEEAEKIMGEARIVIPGVQTIFGFQLVAVFGAAYSEKLNHFEQHIHLAAMVMLAWALGLLMAPAAFHRRKRPDILTRRWVRISSQFLAWGMNLFMISMTAEIYLLSRAMGLLLEASLAISFSVLVVFLVLWIISPRFYVK